jgi:hypothetical protein
MADDFGQYISLLIYLYSNIRWLCDWPNRPACRVDKASILLRVEEACSLIFQLHTASSSSARVAGAMLVNQGGNSSPHAHFKLIPVNRSSSSGAFRPRFPDLSVSRAQARIGGAIPRDKFLEPFLKRRLRAVAEQLSCF